MCHEEGGGSRIPDFDPRPGRPAIQGVSVPSMGVIASRFVPISRARMVWTLLGMGLFGSAACSGRAAPADARYVSVHNTLTAMGLLQIGPLQQGSLAQGQEQKLRVELPAQCVTVVALGTGGARDLDLTLYDPEGKPVGSDSTKEPQAALRACLEASGSYAVGVRMAAGAGDFLLATWAGGSGTASPVAAPPTAQAAGTCDSPAPLTPGTVMGSTARGESEHEGSCGSTSGKELVYRFELPRRQRVTLEVDPQFDAVLYVRKEHCADEDEEVACNDDAFGSAGRRSHAKSKLDEVLEPGVYFVFVDGSNDQGRFKLTTSMADVPSAQERCRDAPRLLLSGSARGTIEASFDLAHATCGDDAKGKDAVYRLEVPQRERVRITGHSDEFSPVVHVRRSCVDAKSEVACSDEGLDDNDASWSGLLDPGVYYVFADADDQEAEGEFSLLTEAAPDGGDMVSGDTCSEAIALTSNEPVSGDTFAARDDSRGRCAGEGAPDVVYRVEVPRRARLTARFQAQEGEHVFVLAKGCGGSEIACGPFLDAVVAPGTYYLGVDGAKANAMGRFRFEWQARDVGSLETACRAPATITPGKTITGTTTGLGNKFTASCAGAGHGSGSSDRVYRLSLARRTRVRLQLSTPGWDGVLSVRRACMDALGGPPSEVACNNDAPDVHHARIETTLDAGSYYVVVDGHASGNEGPFTLEYNALR